MKGDQNNMGDKMRELLTAKRRRGWYLALTLVLAVLVTAGVGGLFHQPAVAKTYQVTALTCTAEAPAGPGYAGYFVHTHNEDCFDENETLVCPLPEIKAHVHDETCYTTTAVQTCGLAESDGHQHTEACYTRVRGDLICEKSTDPVLDEAGNVLAEGHVHTDECFAWTEDLTCGMEEGEGAHHHNDSCFEYVTRLTCGMPEVILHTHTDDCYQKDEDGSIYVDEDGNTLLICGLPEVTEHVHGPECFTVYELDDEEAGNTENTEGDESGLIFLFPEEEEEEAQPAESANPEAETGDTDATEDGNADPADGNTPDADNAADAGVTDNTESTDSADSTNDTAPKAEGENQEAASGETAPIAEEPHTVVYTGTRGAEKGGVTVLAEIPEGALDESAQLVLADADESAARKQILQLVNENAAEGEEREISSMLLLDIGFVSGGEPAAVNGLDPIRVTIKAAAIRSMSAPKLFHLSDGTAREVKDVLFDAEAGTAVFTGITFSPFAVVDLTGEDLAEEAAEETIGVSMPAQSFTGETDGVIVSVEAPEGAFPEGTTMVFSPVEMDDDTLSNVTGAVESSGEQKLVTAQAVDISFFDAEGTLIEPKLPSKVSMKSALVSESENVALVHLTEAAAADPAENAEAEATEAPAAPTAEVVTDVQVVENPDEHNEIQFESDAFSVYVLVGTETITTNYITADGETYTITVTYGPEAMIPAGATLAVAEIPQDSEEYAAYLAQAQNAVKAGAAAGEAEAAAEPAEATEDAVETPAEPEAAEEAPEGSDSSAEAENTSSTGGTTDRVTVTTARFFDITILDAEGNPVEPAAPVDVKIEYMEPAETAENYQVVHFGEETEVLNPAVSGADGTASAFDFQASSFSVFGVVGTKIITMQYITASGETYEISVTYGPGAGIPDGATLFVEEVLDEETYGPLMEKAEEAVVIRNGENNILSARFFNIEIRNGEEVIEPAEPVSVTIIYKGGSVSLGADDTISAIHFGENGVELTEVEAEQKEPGSTEIVFQQGSFSVTGTVITSGVISNGDYCILYMNGSNYYALRNDGSAVQVTVEEDGTVKPVSGEDLPTNLIWTRRGQVWRGNQNSGRYLYPGNGSATNTSSANLTITSSDDSEGNEVYKFSRSQTSWYSTTTYYLRFNNGGFTGGTSTDNNQLYLAWINSDTNVTIHYGYRDDSGNYVEWTDRQKTLRNPNMLGDQYDVRVDIDGYEYITTRLSSSSGRDIINLLQTEQDKLDGGNTPVSSDNNITAVWRFREATKDNAIYPSWSGIAYDYRLADNILGDQDIYVVYRQNTKASSSGGQDLDDIDAPQISKEKQDNGDGTYDIDLSVTAEAASAVHSGRANIAIVLDTSGSMNESASSGGTKWSLVTSSVKTLARDLLGLNTVEEADRVEFALVNFSNYVKNENWIYSVGSDNKNEHFYTNAGAFNSIIDGLQVQGGTCWDKALAAANSILWDDDDPVYVVFISDGDTNSRAYANGNYDLWDGGTYVDNTYSTDYDNNINAKYNVDSATNFADQIRAKGGTIYTVGITGGGNLVNLYRLTHGTSTSHPYHYDVSDSAGIQDAFTSIKNSILSTLGYQDVVVTDGLTGMTQTALVNGNAGNFTYTVAKYTTSVEKLAALPEGASLRSTKEGNGNITSFTRNTGTDSTTYPYIKTVKTVASDSKATVTKNNNGTLTIAFPDGTSDTVNQAIYTTTDGTKTVTWNFGDNYQLRDGYTYTVSFTVWPNQASYDLLAALRNGLLTWGDDYSYTDESGQQQTITFADYSAQVVKSDEDYSLRSNVETGNKVSYSKVSTETLTKLPAGVSEGTTTDPATGVSTTYTRNGNGTYTKTVKTPGTLNFVNPEPMPLAGSKIAMTKVWNDTLDRGHLDKLIAEAEAAGKTYSVTLVVYQNGTEYKRYTFQPVKKYYMDASMSTEAAEGVTTEYYKYVWPSQDVAIAPALLVSDPPEGHDENGYKTVTLKNKTYYVLNEGHSYTIDETETDFHFEFTADPYYPALIDSASDLTNVHFETNDDGSIKNGSTASVSGTGNLESFTASNSLTSELDITKKISDPKELLTDAQEDAETFTYKVTLTVPKETEANHLYAYEFVPRSDAWNGSNRVYAYGYQNSDADSIKGLADDVARFNQQVFGRYTVSYPSEINTLADLFTDDANGTTKTGTLYITLKRNEIIRFTNLPLGTQYKIQEIYANLRQSDPSLDADSLPEANTEASNIEQQGYSVSVATKNGDPTVSTTATANDTVSGTITELDTRYYNQFTNTLDDAAAVNLAVTKHLQGYQWSGERYYVKLTDSSIINRFTDTQRYLTRASGSEDVTNTYASPLRFAEEGEYSFTFTEYDSTWTDVLSETNTGGIQYGAPVTVKVTVENVNGKLTVTKVEGGTLSEDKSLITATITNRKGVELQLLKLGDGDFSKPLEGIQFKLYSDQDCADEHQVVTDLTGAAIGADGLIVTSSDDSDKGMAYLGSLGTGTYYLKEIAGHDGYNMLAELISITIGTDGNVSYSQSSYANSGKGPDLVYKDKSGKYYYYSKIRNDESDIYKDDDTKTFSGYRIIVSNQSGVELPQTGGTGTALFTALGGIMTVTTGAILTLTAYRRRKQHV